MVQNELILVLQYAYLDPQLHRHTGLAFADPLGVRLEYREYLLLMGDDLPQDDAASGLVNLTRRVAHEALDLEHHDNIPWTAQSLLRQPGKRIARLVQILRGYFKVVVVSLGNQRFALLLPLCRLGFAALFVLRRAHEPLHVPHVVGGLPPIAGAVPITQIGYLRDELTHRVIEQVDIGGVMHIRFNHKGVAPPKQRCAVLFFYHPMAGLHHDFIDSGQQLRRQQAHVVFERLEMVGLLIERAVSEHLANRVVVINQFAQAVVVLIQVQPEHTTHQNLPQRHARAPIALVNLRRNFSIEQRKNLLSQIKVHIYVLQAFQNLRYVVSRSGIEFDL